MILFHIKFASLSTDALITLCIYNFCSSGVLNVTSFPLYRRLFVPNPLAHSTFRHFGCINEPADTTTAHIINLNQTSSIFYRKGMVVFQFYCRTGSNTAENSQVVRSVSVGSIFCFQLIAVSTDSPFSYRKYMNPFCSSITAPLLSQKEIT